MDKTFSSRTVAPSLVCCTLVPHRTNWQCLTAAAAAQSATAIPAKLNRRLEYSRGSPPAFSRYVPPLAQLGDPVLPLMVSPTLLSFFEVNTAGR